MGLLSRASTLDEKEITKKLAFTDFIIKHSLKACAMLVQDDVHYLINQSIGFDALSHIKSFSTSDFWNGIFKDSHKIHNFSGSELSPLLQLFSDSLKEQLKELYLYKNSNSDILLSFEEITSDMAKDFENIAVQTHSINIRELNPNIAEGSVLSEFIINCSEAIDSLILSELSSDKEHKAEFQKSIMNEIYNRFSCIYNYPDSTVISDETSLKTIFITDKTYSVDLLTNHIILNLREVLANHAELIEVEYCGKADSCEQIENFLQAE